MNKSVMETVKLNLKTLVVPYVITAFCFLFMLFVELIKYSSFRAGINIGEQTNVSIGNFLWLLIPLAAIFIAARNLSRIVNLGGKRKQYFIGSIISYAILAAAVSLTTTLLYYLYDSFILSSGMYKGLINLVEVWGWAAHRPVVTFFQQFAFLLLVAALFHTFTLIQDSWQGWIADVIVAVLIIVFVSIAPLQAVLHSFFRLLLYHPSALFQITSCFVLAAVIYLLSYPILSHKRI